MSQQSQVAIKIVIASFFNKLADTLSNAKTVMTWAMASVGAPTALTGLLVPIREAGSLVPQILVSGKARCLAKRKKLLVCSIALQAVCIAIIAAMSNSLTGGAAGWILLFVALYSASRSVSSLTSKDVLAKVIDKGQRGSLMGWSATLAGLISIGFGMSLVLEWLAPKQNYVILLAIASCCFTVASLAYFCVDEPQGETEPTKSFLDSLANGWELARSDSKFRAFIAVRAMLVSSSLASPYLVVMVQNANGGGWLSTLGNLGTFIVMSGFASLVSARLWGGFADRNSRAVLAVTAAATSVLCVMAYLLVLIEPDSKALFSLLLFLLLSIIHQGVRLGRKTYVVDIAEGNQRSDYIAVSNTAIGLILIVVGVLGSLIAEVSIGYAFIFFAVLAGTAAISCRFLAKPV